MVQAIKNKEDSPQLTKAKQVSIISLLPTGTMIRKSGNKYMVCCPIHLEKNPSLAIYPTNTWNCFAGCGGGDAIDFYQKLHGVDFKTALEELTCNQ